MITITDKEFKKLADYAKLITASIHTFFMRKPDRFFYFRDKVLPYIKYMVKDKDLRIWSAGCSSGEEPYTLAVIIDEFL